MEKSLIESKPALKRVLYKFSSDEVAKIEDDIVREINRKRTFKGFRPGKAPKNVIKLFLGDDFEELVGEYLKEKVYDDIEKEKWIMRYELESYSRNDEGAEIEALIFEVPKIVEEKISEIKVKIPKLSVEDYIQRYLEIARRLEAISKNKKEDSPIEEGDRVKIKFEVNGKEEEIWVDITNAIYQYFPYDELKKLIGKKVGEELVLKLDEENEVNVKIEEVKELVLPELNDEFAKKVSGYETLEEWKGQIKQLGELDVKSIENELAYNYLSANLPNYIEIEVDDEVVEYLTDERIKRLKSSKDYYEKLLESFENSEDKLRENIKENVINTLKLNAFVRLMEEEGKGFDEERDVCKKGIERKIFKNENECRRYLRNRRFVESDTFKKLYDEAFQEKVIEFAKEKGLEIVLEEKEEQQQEQTEQKEN